MFHRFLQEHSLEEYSFSADLFPTAEDRAFWEAFPNEECVALAEKALDYSWPIIRAGDFMEFKISGNRTEMERVHFDRRQHLVLFALAELKENRRRFLPQLVNGIFAICEESFWGVSAHMLKKEMECPNLPNPAEPYIDLFSAETAEHLAMIAALLKKPLKEFCPEILSRIDYELDRRIFCPYETRLDFWWMGHGKVRPNNWNPWILSNLMTVLFLSEEKPQRQVRILRKMLLEAQNYYDALPEDGGCDEGPHYWDRAGASLFEIVYQLKLASRGAIDLFGDEKLGRIAEYMKKVHVTSNLFVPVGDAHAARIRDGVAMLFGFARELGREDLMNFAAAIYQEDPRVEELVTHRLCTVRRILWQADWSRRMAEYPTHRPLHGPLEQLFALQTAALREGDWFLFAKGGHNGESHNHNDVGSFVLYEDSRPVLIDVGIGLYTRFTFDPASRYVKIPWTRSLHHNLPWINETEQSAGKAFCARDFSARAGEIRISFASAYPEQAGVTSVVRTLRLKKTGMECKDCFSFSERASRRVTEKFLTVLPVRLEKGAAVLDERYRILSGGGTVSVTFLPFEDALLESDWQSRGVTEICISFDAAEEIAVSLEKIR